MISSSVKSQFYTTISANLLSIGYGIILGWASPNLPLLQSDNTPLSFGRFTQDEITWLSSSLSIGNLIGTLVNGLIVDYFGRKIAIYFLALPMIINWLLLICAQNPLTLIIARGFGGFVGGGTYIIIPLYVTEIAEDHVRGSLGSFVQVTCNFGILLGYIWGSYLNFYVFAYLALIFPIAFLILFFIVPETPSFLLSKNKNDKAEKSLRYFRGIKENVTTISVEFLKELEKIKLKLDEKRNSKLEMKDFFGRAPLKAIIISGVVIVGTQASGIFFLINYAAMVFDAAETELSSNLSAIIFMSVNFVGSYFSIIFVDKKGRKVLLTYSSLFTGIFLSIMGIYLYCLKLELDLTYFKWVPLFSLSAAIFCSSWGVVTLPYLLMAEMLPIKTRGIVTTFWRTIMGLIGFVILKYYHNMVENLHMYGCMWMFAIFCFLETLFVIFYVPETKGKSIDEIIKILDNCSDKNNYEKENQKA